MIRVAEPGFSPTTSLALLLSASAGPGGDRPEIVQIAEVEEALVLGADAVVLFTALGGETEVGMIDILSSVGLVRGARDAVHRGGRVPDDLRDRRGAEAAVRVRVPEAERAPVRRARRVRIVKTNWPGDPESFGKLVEAANRIPVVLAGGSRLEDKELLWRMQVAVEAGAIGSPSGGTSSCTIRPRRSPALSRVIRERWSADKAHEALLEELGS